MEEIRDSFRGVHCVIHCAALVSYSFPPDHDALHRINVTEEKLNHDFMYTLDFTNKNRKSMWLIKDEIENEITDKQEILEELYETGNRPDDLAIEDEAAVSEDEKGFTILRE
ncbi:hypothetical protein ANN_08159 [Periplaneta americana]|uniref:Alcohol-forming fatty acyl-CoA reductase n=1 Tax=Periplaneta americana TaxID=6978 RepID=A0ABQ8T215_PERAM|nr:hypothetical protein ANN_08159 [Periplaneta americana]